MAEREIDWELERFLDTATREAPEALNVYQMVFQGLKPAVVTDTYLRAKALHDEDPKGFQAMHVGLEVQYQKQLASANVRDRRSLHWQGRAERAEAQLVEIKTRDCITSTVEEDRGHQKAAELIERLRAEALEASHAQPE